MAKIFSFTKSPDPMGSVGFDTFVDDSALLEFPQPETPQPPEPCSECTAVSDWSNQELADLYRAHALIQAAQPGLECDRGVADEGDPWFVIGKSNGDVLIQICRINGTYILDSVSLSHVLSGRNFNALVEDFLTTVTENRENKTGAANVVRLTRGGTVCLHPSMMIAALIWTLLQDADELTLPLANGSDAHDGTKALADASPLADIPYENEMLFTDHPADLEKGDAFAVDWPEHGMTSQRDEKQIYSGVLGCSQALTTVAIAAGVYASLEAMDAFWKFTQNASDTPVSLEGAEPSEMSGVITPLELLPKALALLSRVVDLASLDSSDAADAHIVQEEDAFEPVNEGLDILVGQQVVMAESEASNIFTEARLVKMTDVADDTIAALPDPETQTAIPDGVSESGQTQSVTYSTQGDVSDDSILDIKAMVTSLDVDITHYATSSFEDGLGKFNGELLQYADILKSSLPLGEDEAGLSFAPEDMEPTSPSRKKFDDAARGFLDEKISNSNLEILVFENEMIFIDPSSFAGNSVSISWQLEDGGLISMIGLSSEISEFLAA